MRMRCSSRDSDRRVGSQTRKVCDDGRTWRRTDRGDPGANRHAYARAGDEREVVRVAAPHWMLYLKHDIHPVIADNASAVSPAATRDVLGPTLTRRQP